MYSTLTHLHDKHLVIDNKTVRYALSQDVPLGLKGLTKLLHKFGGTIYE